MHASKPKRFLLAALSLVFSTLDCAAGAANAAPESRETLSLDRNWRFHEGDIPFPVVTGHQATYFNAKAGRATGAAATDFDDSTWKTIDLPHDWAVEGPFDPNANLAQGFRPRGMGWYRKYFRLDPADRNKHLELQFDGITTYCTIWVNGFLVERNWCGYTSMYIDITPFAKFGNDINTIAIQVDAVAQEGWWYEGAGIYRHTWLVQRNPVHIETDGVYANPIRGTDGKWSIPVEVTLNTSDTATAKVEVESTLIDPSGKPSASVKAMVTIEPFKTEIAKLALDVVSPQLWSVDEPTLHSIRTVVKRDGAEIDRVITPCGFRTIRFDADKGFFLNDRPLKLMGTSNHQDMAGVGVAVPDSIWEFRIRRLKEMGSNAYRCSHDPPAKEFLDACDRQGMLVIDENRNFGSSPEELKQVRWMVKRDRNHPSVILWSLFNEESYQGNEIGYEIARRMKAAVKELDGTRPVTAAQSNSVLNPVNTSQVLDVTGINYGHRDFDEYHAKNPTQPVLSSEDTSTVMTRDEFVTNKKQAVLDSYDDQVVKWGLSHRNMWRQVAVRPFMAGLMVWTGFDYRGEPQPLTWPATGSSFGCMDLCGFPKTAYYIHQAQWIKDRPILHLVPHWNWAGSEGKPIKVMALTNAEKVTLYLNGKSLGEKNVDKYEMLTVEVPYEAGKLEAVATRAGTEVARSAVETTGPPAALKLLGDRNSLAGDGADAEAITVEAVDSQGRIVPTAKLPVEFQISGPGRIIGLNNGDPNCHEPEKGNAHSIFNGLGQVIVQSAYEGNGPLTLRATAAGLDPAETVIAVKSVPSRPAVAITAPTLVISRWRMSPVFAEQPDPNQKGSETDVNTWGAVQTGRLVPFTSGRFAIFRADFKPRAQVVQSGGKLTLADITGKARVWLNGKQIGEKADFDRGTITVPLPAAVSDMTLNVVIETTAGGRAGLGGPVSAE